MSKKITEKVSWVGKVDWELQTFHGDELSTRKGSSYNAYLIRDEKTVLIDTVWLPYDKEFVSRLKQEIPLEKLDAIVMLHNEVDHSGSLPELLREIPDVPIYCTAKGEAILRGHYHQDWNFRTVKTGCELDLGETKLTFIEAAMMHWPDTMFAFMSGENILFSNDGFGQHYASESLYDDCVPQEELFYEAEKYYTNILNPFSPMVAKKLKEIEAMGLPELRLICPSHGVIWRSHIADILAKYAAWSQPYQEDQITLLYDTMWQSTRKMAEAIAEGIRSHAPQTTVKLQCVSKEDKNDVLVEVFRSKGVLVGSPTINNGPSFAMAGILEMMKGLKFKQKKGGVFGSYGWNGAALKPMAEMLASAGFELVGDPAKALWVPDEDALAACRKFGEEFAAAFD